jgi:hypothetical protein
MVNGCWVTERVETMYQTVANGATMGGVPQYRPGPPFYCCPSEMRTVYDAAPEYRAYMAFSNTHSDADDSSGTAP